MMEGFGSGYRVPAALSTVDLVAGPSGLAGAPELSPSGIWHSATPNVMRSPLSTGWTMACGVPLARMRVFAGRWIRQRGAVYPSQTDLFCDKSALMGLPSA
jgi:hypothetical protein